MNCNEHYVNKEGKIVAQITAGTYDFEDGVVQCSLPGKSLPTEPSNSLLYIKESTKD
jgi:hypothetical protein